MRKQPVIEQLPGELRFRPCGVGRFFGAAFLIVWLCGWVVGEAAALFVLCAGIAALLTGSPIMGGVKPLQIGPALAVGGFLLVWLTFWTVGGWAALRELLRSLWAEDCLEVQPDGLVVTNRLGPFSSQRRLAVTDIRRVYVWRPNSVLMAQVGTSTMTLTDLGTPEQRAEAARKLQSALGLADDPSAAIESLPEGWQEVGDFGGDRAVVPDLRIRRKQAFVVFVIAGIVWSGLLVLFQASWRDANLWVVTAMLGILAVWLAWQTIWLYRGRKEWRIERGRLIHQRRFGREVSELAESRALELTESTDGDNDRWYHLQALGVDEPGRKPGRRITIHRTIHDPTEPRALGQYLARHSGVTFRDLVPAETTRRAEIRHLLEALAASDKLGRWLAGKVKRASEC